jgi:hypothetical protein
MGNNLGEKFIQFLADRNYNKMKELYHPDVTARLLIPGGLLTVYDSENLIKKISSWFADSEKFELVDSQVDELGGKLGVRYKFRGIENNEAYIVEQQTFLKIIDGKIHSFDLLCSGFQKITG